MEVVAKTLEVLSVWAILRTRRHPKRPEKTTGRPNAERWERTHGVGRQSEVVPRVVEHPKRWSPISMVNMVNI